MLVLEYMFSLRERYIYGRMALKRKLYYSPYNYIAYVLLKLPNAARLGWEKIPHTCMYLEIGFSLNSKLNLSPRCRRALSLNDESNTVH